MKNSLLALTVVFVPALLVIINDQIKLLKYGTEIKFHESRQSFTNAVTHQTQSGYVLRHRVGTQKCRVMVRLQDDNGDITTAPAVQFETPPSVGQSTLLSATLAKTDGVTWCHITEVGKQELPWPSYDRIQIVCADDVRLTDWEVHFVGDDKKAVESKTSLMIRRSMVPVGFVVSIVLAVLQFLKWLVYDRKQDAPAAGPILTVREKLILQVLGPDETKTKFMQEAVHGWLRATPRYVMNTGYGDGLSTDEKFDLFEKGRSQFIDGLQQEVVKLETKLEDCRRLQQQINE